MKRLLGILIFIVVCVNFVFAETPKLINDKNGFRIIHQGQEIMIDREPRFMVRNKIELTDINRDGEKELIVYYYVDYRIRQISMVIISDDIIVFDSKEKLLYDVHPRLKGEGNFNEDLYTHRTTYSGDQIFLDINRDGRYKKFIRFTYDNKTFSLVQVENKIEIDDYDRYPVGRINDPDGYTNLRSGPSKQSSVIAKVTKYEVFYILERGPEWYKIKTWTGVIGYMHKSRIKEEKK